jgi:hypothetical protein
MLLFNPVGERKELVAAWVAHRGLETTSDIERDMYQNARNSHLKCFKFNPTHASMQFMELFASQWNLEWSANATPEHIRKVCLFLQKLPCNESPPKQRLNWQHWAKHLHARRDLEQALLVIKRRLALLDPGTPDTKASPTAASSTRRKPGLPDTKASPPAASSTRHKPDHSYTPPSKQKTFEIMLIAAVTGSAVIAHTKHVSKKTPETRYGLGEIGTPGSSFTQRAAASSKQFAIAAGAFATVARLTRNVKTKSLAFAAPQVASVIATHLMTNQQGAIPMAILKAVAQGVTRANFENPLVDQFIQQVVLSNM